MTPDEIREPLSRTLDKLDALYADHIAGKELFSKEREYYLTAFFEAVCNGREDYENLLPSTIDIAR